MIYFILIHVCEKQFLDVAKIERTFNRCEAWIHTKVSRRMYENSYIERYKVAVMTW